MLYQLSYARKSLSFRHLGSHGHPKMYCEVTVVQIT